ncbi:MAG: hypothetical protein WD823_12625 [Sulfuricaulis sp.]|uniref:hypothetical protein n=1 Tax=Sulfuricaulis sp. TaxID=2003553 RepID=UPI0034A32CFB
MTTLEILMKSYPGRILLTVDETAHACGLAPGTLRTRLSRKTFPIAHRKFGDKTLFHIEAVAKFIDGLPSVGKRGRGRPPKVEAPPVPSIPMA